MKWWQVTLIFILSGCGYSHGITSEDVERCSLYYNIENTFCERVLQDQQAFEDVAIMIVKGSLKDPYSAKFVDVRTNGNKVVGYVNAKNSYGAYGGSKKFELRHLKNGELIFTFD